MKRSIVSSSIIVFTLLLTSFLAKTFAAEKIGKEMPLNPKGEAYELFRDEYGSLWISDSLAGEIWRVNPTTGIYTVFENLEGATDGKTNNI